MWWETEVWGEDEVRREREILTDPVCEEPLQDIIESEDEGRHEEDRLDNPYVQHDAVQSGVWRKLDSYFPLKDIIIG